MIERAHEKFSKEAQKYTLDQLKRDSDELRKKTLDQQKEIDELRTVIDDTEGANSDVKGDLEGEDKSSEKVLWCLDRDGWGVFILSCLFYSCVFHVAIGTISTQKYCISRVKLRSC